MTKGGYTTCSGMKDRYITYIAVYPIHHGTLCIHTQRHRSTPLLPVQNTPNKKKIPGKQVDQQSGSSNDIYGKKLPFQRRQPLQASRTLYCAADLDSRPPKASAARTAERAVMTDRTPGLPLAESAALVKSRALPDTKGTGVSTAGAMVGAGVAEGGKGEGTQRWAR